MLIFSHVITRVDSGQVCIAVHNCSMQPAKIYANSVVGKITPIHFNPQIAVLVDPSNRDNDDGPIGFAEDQFDETAQGEYKLSEASGTSTNWTRALAWKNSILTTAQRTALIALLLNFSNVFSHGPTDIGHTTLLKHDIDVGEAKPLYQRQYRIPHAYRPLVAEQTQRLQKAGVISPSTSAWNSPLVVVRKKTDDGTVKIRCCLDLRGVNKLIKLAPYAMPRIDDMLDQLGKAKYISVLDMTEAYAAIELTERAKDITSFQVPSVGKFRYERLPFGLASAGFQFQQLVEMVLDISRSPWTAAYLDDVLVISESFEEHLKHLKDVFTKLQRAGLKLGASKCQFCQSEVLYLGHTITPNGLKPANCTIQKIEQFKPPKDKTALKSFLGLVGYYRRFIEKFAMIAQPLHALLPSHTVHHSYGLQTNNGRLRHSGQL